MGECIGLVQSGIDMVSTGDSDNSVCDSDNVDKVKNIKEIINKYIDVL